MSMNKGKSDYITKNIIKISINFAKPTDILTFDIRLQNSIWNPPYVKILIYPHLRSLLLSSKNIDHVFSFYLLKKKVQLPLVSWFDYKRKILYIANDTAFRRHRVNCST